jgi:hypothetical protein
MDSAYAAMMTFGSCRWDSMDKKCEGSVPDLVTGLTDPEKSGWQSHLFHFPVDAVDLDALLCKRIFRRTNISNNQESIWLR